MKITEALVVLFLVLFCYLFLDKFLFRGELGEICFGPTCRALARWPQTGKPDPSRPAHAAAGVGRQPLPLKTMRWSSPGTTAPVSGRQHAPRHATPGARGTIQTRATIHLYRQATAIRNIALCKRPFRGGYIRTYGAHRGGREHPDARSCDRRGDGHRMRNDGPACRDAEFLSATVGLHPRLVQGAGRA